MDAEKRNRAVNREKLLLRVQRYRAANPQKVAARLKIYKAANWRKTLADKQKYRARNRRSISIAAKKYRSANQYLLMKKKRKWYQVNRARRVLLMAKRRLMNPEKTRYANAVNYFRFRDRIRIGRKSRYAVNPRRELEQQRNHRALQRSRRAGSEGPDVLRKPRKNVVGSALRRFGISKLSGVREALERSAEKGLENCCPQILLLVFMSF